MNQSDNLTEAELRRRLAEAEAALAALRSGKADTLIGDAGPLLFQLKSAVEAQKQAEEALRREHTLLERITSASPAGITVVDRHGQITFANPQAEKILGLTKEAITQRTYNAPAWRITALDGGPFPDEELPFRRVMATLKPVTDIRHAIEWPDGRRVLLSINGAPLLDASGELEGAVFTVSDITEQLQAEAALRENEAKLAAILRSTDNGILVVSPQGKVISLNPRFAEMWRIPDKLLQTGGHEVLLRYVMDQLETPNEFLQKVQQLYQSDEESFDIIRFKDGRVFERYTNIVKHEEQRIGRLWSFRDVTERKQAEDRIRQLAAFPELNPNPVLEFAADGSLTYHNPAAQELVRRSGARDLQELMPPNSDQIIRECLASGRPCLRLEVRCGERTISWSFYPIEQLGVVHAYAGDITERKQAEVAQARLATAIEQAAEAVMIADTQGTLQYVNPAFEKVTGYSREEAIGRNPRFLKSGKHDTEFYQRLWAVLTRGEVWRGHFVNKRKDGTLYEEEATISPVRDAAGRIIHYVAVKRDVTREAQLEAQLLQAQKMEAIGRLAGGVAHDFNNILAVILMQTEFLLMSVDLSEGVRDGVQQVRTAAERAANLTRQLLLFSRRQVMQARDLDLNEVVTNLAKMLQRIIGEDVRLELHLHPTPLMTHADAGMLDQVLMNLAVNARDAMPKGGRLIIETTAREFSPEEAAALPDVKPGHYVGLRVSDTGCGIPPEILPRIFEPFFTTKEQGKGTGLGLATVFGIVKQHGGSIQVASELGRGTTFEVYIPALPSGSTQATAAESRTPPRGGTETILLVEDEPDVRQVTRVILEVHGYRVLEASDGHQALELWQQHRETIQLLFTDMVMPEGMSGRELSQRLRADRPQLKVLYTSGYSAELAGQELPPGASFLQKPCSAELLLETVRRCLDAPSEAPLI